MTVCFGFINVGVIFKLYKLKLNLTDIYRMSLLTIGWIKNAFGSVWVWNFVPDFKVGMFFFFFFFWNPVYLQSVAVQ
jgi:hypothetical protein